MTIYQLARLYVRSRLISDAHGRDVLSVSRRASQVVRGNVSVQSLTKYLSGQLQRRSPATVAKHRRLLQAVLNWAAEQGLCPAMRLPRIRVPARIPQAWTVRDVERLLQAASALSGWVGTVPARRWWPALILAIYWTGARLGTLLAATPSDWDGHTLILRHSKTGRIQVVRLHRQANEAISRIYDPASPRLFFWPRSRWALYRDFRKICQTAGVPTEHKAYSLFHRLRRTCLTYCWAADPAVAVRQADHANPETTKRHYVDIRLVLGERQAADVLPVPKWEGTDGQPALPFPWG